MIKTGEDSLKKRYSYKLFTNTMGVVTSVIAQAIIPRGLGPKAYGDFNFLTSFFTEVVNFFDMGSSFGFYTKLSQRQKETGLVRFYLYFNVIVFFTVFGLVMLLQSTPLFSKIWPSQSAFYIYLGALLALMTWITANLGKMVDAYGITVLAEKAKMVQKILGTMLVAALFFLKELDLATFFYYNYFILLFIGIAFILIIEREGHDFFSGWKLPLAAVKKYFAEFYKYTHPLFIYLVVGLVVGIFDRWLLQVYGGSIQQGFYGFSYQIGTFSFLFFSAMTPLIMREFSIAYGNKDHHAIAYLFRRYVPLLYSVSAYFACFIVFQADKVIYIFGGESYKKALPAFVIMAFFPIHAAYGQLSSSLFYATERTALYRNIGIVFMLIGLPVTYFLIAPPERFGLNAGAVGIAIKMVLVQFFWVNTQFYFNARYLNLRFGSYLMHQAGSVLCLLTVAFLATFSVDALLHFGKIANCFIAGILYTFTVIAMVYLYPGIFGIEKRDVTFILDKVYKKLRSA